MPIHTVGVEFKVATRTELKALTQALGDAVQAKVLPLITKLETVAQLDHEMADEPGRAGTYLLGRGTEVVIAYAVGNPNADKVYDRLVAATPSEYARGKLSAMKQALDAWRDEHQ